MKKGIILILGLSFGVGLFSCKPTVDNYKSAYDLALQKEQGDLDDEIYQKMKEEERPKITIVGNDTIRTKIEQLSLYTEDGALLPVDYKFNVVLGRYKIPVNAKAHCAQLKKDGYKAYMLKNMEQEYYVVASGFNTLEETAAFVKKMEKKYAGRYVGIETPIVVTPTLQMKRF